MPSPPSEKRNSNRPFWKKALRVTGKVLAWLIVIPIILLLLIAVLIYVPPVQNMIRNKAISFLQDKTGTYVELEHIHLRFPIGLTLEGFHMDDLQGDTLVHVGALRTSASLSSLFRQKIVIGEIILEGGRANIHQDQDSIFNFDFIVKAFATPDTVAKVEKVDTTATDKWSIVIEELELEDLRVSLELEPSRLGLDLVVGEFEVDFDDFSLDPQQIYVDDIALRNSTVHMRMAPNDDPPEPDTYPDLENPVEEFDIRFNEFNVENLLFTMKDVVKEDSMWVSLVSLEILSDEMRSKDQKLRLESLMVDQLDFGMLTMAKAAKPEDTIKPADPPWLDQNDGFRYFVRDWDLRLDELRIRESGIAMHTGSIATPTSLLDSAHMVFKDINLELNDVVINNEHVALMIEEFRTRTAEGLPDIQLALGIDARPDEVSVHDGHVAIGENELTFDLSASPGDLSTAYRDPQRIPIRLQAHSELQLSRLAPLLAEFGTELPSEFTVDETWRTDILVQGNIHELDTVKLDLIGDDGSVIHLDGMVHGPTDWPNTTFRLDLDEFTMGKGMREMLRGTLPPEFEAPRRLAITGKASGSNGAVRADLAMNSDAGKIKLDGSASGLTKKIPDNVDLTLNVIDLHTQRFIGDTSIGTVTLDLRAHGERLNTSARSGYLKLDPHEFSYNGIDLSELLLEGTVEGDTVDVAVALSTEQIAVDLKAHGAWPDENDTLRLGLDLLVDHLHLEELVSMKDPLGVEGHWIGDAAFHTEGMGRFRLDGEGVRIFNENTDFIFEEFLAAGHLSADSTAFDLNTDAINVMYHTNIHPDSLISGTQMRLLAIIQDDTSFVATPGKRMEMDITLPRTEWLTEIILPDLDVIELDHFTGSYDSDADELRIDLHLPKLLYNTIEVDELVVDLNAMDNAINGNISVERIDRDSLRIERLRINSTTNAGELTTIMRMEDIEGDRYRIGTVLRTIDEVREVHVKEDLVLNSTPWTIHGDNKISFPDDGPMADQFILSSGAQKVEIRTPPDHVIIGLTAFELTTITDLVSTLDSVPLVEGTLDGELNLPRSGTALLDADLVISHLKALGTELGTLELTAEERSAKKYNATAQLQHEVNRFDMKAFADVSGKMPVVEAEGDLAFEDLSFLKPFVSEWLFALGGGLEGDIRMSMRDSTTTLDGDLSFKEAEAGVIMTGATYRLPDERITFNNQGIHFDAFNLVDSAGNRFQLDGSVDQNAEDGPALDLQLRTDRFQFVNSTSEDSKSFYGDLYTAMDLDITGTASDPFVKGLVSILEGTYMSIVLPGSQIEMVSHEGIVVFTDDYEAIDSLAVRSDSEVLQDSLKASLPGIELDLKIKLSPKATFAIVLDPVTGDAATVSADADLRFRYGHDRDMYLSGPLTLAGGGYTLNFYGLVKKEFEIVKGGTVLWSGDPTAARLDIQARYVSNTAPYSLVANAALGMSEGERNRLQARLPFEVLIGVSGEMNDPKIDFGLDLPRMLRNSYPQVDNRLQQLAQASNEEERNRQVFGLLVLNTFIEDDPGSSPGSGGLAQTAARNTVNNILSDQLNKVTGKIVKGVDISLGVSTYDQAQGDQSYQRTSVDYQVSKRVLDDRLTFEVGGSIGVDEQNSDVSEVSNTRRAQYAIMYDLTEDGRYRLRGFHENAFDLYDGEITRSGIAILYTKEFEENGKARQARREALMKQLNDGPILPDEKDDLNEDGRKNEEDDGSGSKQNDPE